MADPKGTYYSPTSPETGWATVIPQRQRSNFFRQMAQIPMADKKAKMAEDKLKQQQLGKLSGYDIGRFHREAFAKGMSNLVANADKMSLMELNDQIIKYDIWAQSSKSVEKLYDTDVKWAQSKEAPIKTDAWRSAYTEKYYANPSLDTVNKWAEEAPNKTWFLGEDGGSQYVDGGKAIKRVIKNNFNGYLTDQQWSRSGWEKAPTGHVTDLLTIKHKVNAFSTIQKNAAGNDEIVVKEPKELIGENILGTFMEDEYMARVLTDRAKEMIMQQKGVTQVDDDDVTELDLAAALQQELVPYLDGAVSESGMTLAIRPPGQGGGGAGPQKFSEGFNLWKYQVSQGSKNAWDWVKGSKIGDAEIVAFDKGSVGTPTTSLMVYTNEDKLRQAWANQPWFKQMTSRQKDEAVSKVVANSKNTFDPNNAPNVFLTLVTRTKRTPGANDPNQSSYTYDVDVFDPETTTSSLLGLLYTAGRKVHGNQDYDVFVKSGQMGYEFEAPKEEKGWQPSVPAPNTKVPKPKGM